MRVFISYHCIWTGTQSEGILVGGRWSTYTNCCKVTNVACVEVSSYTNFIVLIRQVRNATTDSVYRCRWKVEARCNGKLIFELSSLESYL